MTSSKKSDKLKILSDKFWPSKKPDKKKKRDRHEADAFADAYDIYKNSWSDRQAQADFKKEFEPFFEDSLFRGW